MTRSCERDLDREFASLPYLTFCFDGAAVGFRNILDESKAEAVAVYLGINHVSCPVERLKNMFQVIAADTDSPVFDLELDGSLTV